MARRILLKSRKTESSHILPSEHSGNRSLAREAPAFVPRGTAKNVSADFAFRFHRLVNFSLSFFGFFGTKFSEISEN